MRSRWLRPSVAAGAVVVAAATGVVTNIVTDKWDLALAAVLGILVVMGAGAQVVLTVDTAEEPRELISFREPSFEQRRVGDQREVWNLPIKDKWFSSRENELGLMEAALGVPEGVRYVALHGLGGVGKTTLAIEYAYRFAKLSEIVWLVTASSRRSTVSGLADLAAHLGVEEPSQELAAAKALADLGNRKGWLLIYDNAASVTAVEGLLPPRGVGCVVITSRNPFWRDVADVIEVTPFGHQESVQFLMSQAEVGDSEDLAAADHLATDVHHLPLALEVVASYCRAKGVTLTEYWMLGRSQRARAGQSVVDDCLLLSFDELARDTPAGAEMLRLLVMLAPTGIPRDLVTACPKSLPRRLRKVARDEIELNEVFGALLKTSLVRPGSAGQIQIHELVQEAIRSRIRSQTVSWRRRQTTRVVVLANLLGAGSPDLTSSWTELRWSRVATELLLAAFPFGRHTVASWEQCALLLPHVLEVLDSTSRPADTRSAATLMYRIGRYLYDRGDFEEARSYYARSLSLWQRHVGWRHLETITVADSLAMALLRATGQANAACEARRKVLESFCQVLGREHPKTLFAANKLGMALRIRSEENLTQLSQLIYSVDAGQVGDLAITRSGVQAALDLHQACCRRGWGVEMDKGLILLGFATPTQPEKERPLW